MKPRVTLATPVYNAMPYLRDYLASVLAQSWRPLQFIAVDDGSTDGSYAHLLQTRGALEAAGIELDLLRVPHGGQAAAVSAALPLVRGAFFTWCDADDVLMTDSVEKKALFLLAHPELGMVRSDGLLLWPEKGETAPAAREKDGKTLNIFDALFRGTTYCYSGGYMVRTELLFACYPQKRIPVSPEGQNLQLLLPPASRTACGFVPERLFRYFIRSGGHSSQRRSYTQQLERVENFARLRAEILSYCDCDRAYYLRENERIRQAERRELLQSALLRAREAMQR